MKFRLWHVILTEIANMSPGQKNLESCQTNVLEQSLSSPLAFPILVNIKPYQKYTKITQNAVFNFFGAKFGVLPFLQECPLCFSLMSKVLNVEERYHFLRINQKSPRLSCFSDTCLLYKNWDALSVLVSLCQLYVTLPKQPYIMVSKIFIFRCASISRIEHGDL